MRIALALLLALIVAPLEAQQIDAEAGLWVSGPLVQEVTHRVRLGNMGQEMHMALQVSDFVSDHWRVGGDLMLVPATLYVYPVDPELEDSWFLRPKGVKNVEKILWMCTTLGGWYDRGWFAAGAGLGMCHISNADHTFFGAGPMHNLSSRVGVSFTKSITDNLNASLRCRVHPSPVRGEDYTVLQIASGRLEPGEHDSGDWYWHFDGGCGLGLSVSIGGDR